jgi:2-oxo-4-hydroxy-4-carboxy-5-ureidoimidazoline decarboxylase
MSTTTAIPTAPAGVEALSGLPQAAFVARLGDIFEHSPWVPERAWAARPFASIDALHAAMVAAVDQAAEAEQLALICAHPELAGREAAAGTLTRLHRRAARCRPRPVQRRRAAAPAQPERGLPGALRLPL